MREADIRLALHHAMQWRGWAPYHYQDGRVFTCPVCHKGKILTTPTTPGRSDTVAKHFTVNTLPAYIEVKDVKDMSFPYNEITEDQHKYLSARANSYLCIGKIVPLGEKKTTIHSIYVIPWLVWLEWEKTDTILGLKSIPYSYELYTNQVAKKCSDLITRCRPEWELVYVEDDWHLDSTHPLAVQAEVEVPSYKREKEIVNEINNTASDSSHL